MLPASELSKSKKAIAASTVLASAGFVLLIVSCIATWVTGELHADGCTVGWLGMFKSSFDPTCAESTVVPGEKFDDKPTDEYWPLFGVQNGFGDALAKYGLTVSDFEGIEGCTDGTEVTVKELVKYPTGAFMSVHSGFVEAMQGALTYGVWGEAGMGPAPFDGDGVDATIASLLPGLLYQEVLSNVCKLGPSDTTGGTVAVAENTDVPCRNVLQGAISQLANQMTSYTVQQAASYAADMQSVAFLTAVTETCAFDEEEAAFACATMAARRFESGGRQADAALKPATDFLRSNGLTNTLWCTTFVAAGGNVAYGKVYADVESCVASADRYPVGNFVETMGFLVSYLADKYEALNLPLSKYVGLQRLSNTLANCATKAASASVTVATCGSLTGPLPLTITNKFSNSVVAPLDVELPYTLFAAGTFAGAVTETIATSSDAASVASLQAFDAGFLQNCLLATTPLPNDVTMYLLEDTLDCLNVLTPAFVDTVVEGVLDAEAHFASFPVAGGSDAIAAEAASRIAVLRELSEEQCVIDQDDLDSILLGQILVPISTGLVAVAVVLGVIYVSGVYGLKRIVVAIAWLTAAATFMTLVAFLNVRGTDMYSRVGNCPDPTKVCYEEAAGAIVAKIGILVLLLASVTSTVGLILHHKYETDTAANVKVDETDSKAGSHHYQDEIPQAVPSVSSANVKVQIV